MLSLSSRAWLFGTLWAVAHQSPLSMGFSRQEYWSGLPCPPPGDLPNPEIKPTTLMSPALAGGFFTTSTTWEAHSMGEGKIIPTSLPDLNQGQRTAVNLCLASCKILASVHTESWSGLFSCHLTMKGKFIKSRALYYIMWLKLEVGRKLNSTD